MEGVSAPLLCRTGQKTRSLAATVGGGASRGHHARLQRPRPGTQQCRGLEKIFGKERRIRRAQITAPVGRSLKRQGGNLAGQLSKGAGETRQTTNAALYLFHYWWRDDGGC